VDGGLSCVQDACVPTMNSDLEGGVVPMSWHAYRVNGKLEHVLDHPNAAERHHYSPIRGARALTKTMSPLAIGLSATARSAYWSHTRMAGIRNCTKQS
jgi:hypothetical protein